MIVIMIDDEPTSKANGREAQSNHTGTSTKISEYHNSISAFEKTFRLASEESILLQSLELRTEQECFPPLRKVVDYLRLKIRGTILNIHFSELLEDEMLPNRFS